VNSVGQLDGKKLAALVQLYVFILGFPASPLQPFVKPHFTWQKPLNNNNKNIYIFCKHSVGG
jgi:hypothetical protein